MSHRGTDAICSGVSAAYDDDMFVFGRNIFTVSMIGIEQALGIGMEKIHGEMDAVELAAGYGQVARFCRAATEHNGIKLLFELGGGKIVTDSGIGHELNAFLGHELGTP